MTDINSRDRPVFARREAASTDAAFSRNERDLLDAPKMTLTARLRKGWRLSPLEKAERLPIDRRSQFWTMITLWFLFAASLYAVWSVLY